MKHFLIEISNTSVKNKKINKVVSDYITSQFNFKIFEDYFTKLFGEPFKGKETDNLYWSDTHTGFTVQFSNQARDRVFEISYMVYLIDLGKYASDDKDVDLRSMKYSVNVTTTYSKNRGGDKKRISLVNTNFPHTSKQMFKSPERLFPASKII